MSAGAITEITYIVASILFILGVRSLTRPDTARLGMQLAALGMVVAIAGTFFVPEIVQYWWIIAGLIVGAIAGYPLGMWVKMTAMPQRIAISHTLGSLAAVLVGIAEYHNALGLHRPIGAPRMAALGLEILFGGMTVTGSFMACGKLQGFISERSVLYPLQNESNIAGFVIAVIMFFYLIAVPANWMVFWALLFLALLLGFLMVLPIGGADMPVLLSLFNSYTGLSAAATGFAIENNVLIITGALDGASGFMLSVLMSKAMNRSFTNVLFGAFGSGAPAAGAVVRSATGLAVKAISPEDAALQLGYARTVAIVPGYGMAVAQCQHQVRELADLIERRGGTVKFAIHPVAGRMPGHMNVLLAEVDIPYDRLYDIDEINPEFALVDVALVIGANDVVNPAAKDAPGSPIYGMPILDVENSKSVIVLKRSMNPGFAGIENDLFYRDKTFMLFGDAKDSLTKLITEMKAM